MFKKLVVPAACSLALTGCLLPTSGDSTTAPATTAPATTTSAPATTTPVPVTTAAPATTAAVPATTAAAAATTVAAAPTTAAPGPTNAPVPAGDLEIITVSGIGSAIPASETVTALDGLGITADSPGTFKNFGGSSAFPFVNIDGARIVELRLSNDEYANWRYTYLINNSASQTPEQLAQAAAAPIKARYPENSEATETRVDGTRSFYQVDLDAAGYEGPDWSVTASNDSEDAALTFISIELRATLPSPVTGPSLIPPTYKAAADPVIAQAKLSPDTISGAIADAGISFGRPSSDLSLDFTLPGMTYQQAVDSLSQLTGQGYTVEPDDGYTVVKNDKVHYQIFDNDDSDASPTKVNMRFEVV